VRGGQTAVEVTIGRRYGFSVIAVASGGDMGLEQGEAQLQKQGEQASFDLIETETLLRGLLDEGDEGLKLLMGLEERLFLSENHEGPP